MGSSQERLLNSSFVSGWFGSVFGSAQLTLVCSLRLSTSLVLEQKLSVKSLELAAKLAHSVGWAGVSLFVGWWLL